MVDFINALAGQRVDKPGLSARKLPDVCQGIRLEELSCRLGMLRVEGGDLLRGEVAQHHVL